MDAWHRAQASSPTYATPARWLRKSSGGDATLAPIGGATVAGPLAPSRPPHPEAETRARTRTAPRRTPRNLTKDDIPSFRLEREVDHVVGARLDLDLQGALLRGVVLLRHRRLRARVSYRPAGWAWGAGNARRSRCVCRRPHHPSRRRCSGHRSHPLPSTPWPLLPSPSGWKVTIALASGSPPIVTLPVTGAHRGGSPWGRSRGARRSPSRAGPPRNDDRIRYRGSCRSPLRVGPGRDHGRDRDIADYRSLSNVKDGRGRRGTPPGRGWTASHEPLWSGLRPSPGRRRKARTYLRARATLSNYRRR